MSLSLTARARAWWSARKEHVYAVAVMAGVPLFLIFAAPYCC